MYLKRKIDKWLYHWKNKEKHLPALIIGVRQCGKTASIMNFGKSYYKNIIYINFWTNPEYSSAFDSDLSVPTIISNISIKFPDIIINPKKTLIVFDEIQECPKARLSLKNFALDGKYDVIGSGSYIGINGYVIGDATPVPTGYEDIFQMKTMDFEEFLWANGYKDKHIDMLLEYFNKKTPVPNSTHTLFKKLFNQYLCIGGFPKAVSAFIVNHNIMDGVRVVQNTLFDMKGDFGRRVDKNGEPVFKTGDVARIQNVFDLIPTFLAKENKRFISSKIISGNSIDKVNAIEYLKQAGIIYKVYNLETPSLPLLGNKISSQFKIFTTDIGILTSMYGLDIISSILNGNLGQGKGAIYEALVFDSLYKADIDTFYFSKNTGLEIDFVICYNGSSYLVEAKAKTGNTKSSKTVMAHPDHYGHTKLLKIGDYNVSEEGDIITIPHYMTFLIGKSQKEYIEDLSFKDNI